MSLLRASGKIIVATFATSATIYFGTCFYKKWKNNRIPSNWQQVGTVKKLYIYPLKSGHRLELEKAYCTKVGLKESEEDQKVFQLSDRGFAVYSTDNNEYRTAKNFPKLFVIKFSVHNETHIAINAPDMETLYVKIPNRRDNPPLDVKCWTHEKLPAVDCGDEAAVWFSQFLTKKNSGLRLAYNDNAKQRDITKTHPDLLNFYKNLTNDATGLFAYLSSILLINQTSVDDMNKRMENSSVSVVNFRANIIIDGPDIQPYDEDKWDWMKIGDGCIFRNVKDCTRCMFTTIHPETGERRRDREPLRTLEPYRMTPGPEKLPIMGLHLCVKQTGLLQVGDPVYVVQFPEK